jgi:molybdopterin synthase catalytic subunit
MAFRLTDTSIDASALMEGLRDTRVGACVTFEGRVRARNGGRAVKALDYEAYGPLAEKEGRKVLSEARRKFRITRAVCVHRTGSLGLGDIAVWVGITAGHRGAAFEACRYVIDEIKARLPIWKKEHYAGGATEWINCAANGRPTRGGSRKRA